MKRHRVAFVIEHTLGHVTFQKTLSRAVSADPSIDPTWINVVYTEPSARLKRAFPLSANYTVATSFTARRALKLDAGFDALFVHTPACALMLSGVMRRIPTVVSLDATPRNIDEVGGGYKHEVRSGGVERLKALTWASVVRPAVCLMPWNDWAAESLVGDYRIPRSKVKVIGPGVPIPDRPVVQKPEGGPVRLLFVGGDFERKGGADLLKALANLRYPWVCDVVTKSTTIRCPPGVTVHRDLSPGDRALNDLYAQADIFILPTHGDAHPLVTLEAMAAGLPVIATRVGAIPDLVKEGVAGLLVPPGDADALGTAISRLASDRDERRLMAAAARNRAITQFDEVAQGKAILDLVKAVSQSPRRQRRRAPRLGSSGDPEPDHAV